MLIRSLLILLASITLAAAQNVATPRDVQALARPVSPSSGTGAVGPRGQFYEEQVYHIPIKNLAGQRLAVIFFRNPVGGQKPLAIITHGTESNQERNRDWRIGYYPRAIEFFIKQGYHVAVVHRRGFGLTGGERSENASCMLQNHILAGNNSAHDLTSALDYFTRLPEVKNKDAIAIGQSTGGWSVVALASTEHPSLKAVINFSGGRRIISGATKLDCAEEQLVKDVKMFGENAKKPSLWIYTRNDKTFSVDLIEKLQRSYVSAGAKQNEFHLLPAFGGDGHSLFPHPRGIDVWAPIVKNYLSKL